LKLFGVSQLADILYFFKCARIFINLFRERDPFD
jgi:hypothetical protein